MLQSQKNANNSENLPAQFLSSVYSIFYRLYLYWVLPDFLYQYLIIYSITEVTPSLEPFPFPVNNTTKTIHHHHHPHHHDLPNHLHPSLLICCNFKHNAISRFVMLIPGYVALRIFKSVVYFLSTICHV